MKQSIGYTVSLNIAITFIIIVFAFIAMALSYYRAFKVSKIITATIEKNEGYTVDAEEEIINKLASVGYTMNRITCRESRNGCSLLTSSNTNGTSHYNGDLGYCVYYCNDGEGYYRYKTTTNMMLNIPIINSIANIPVEINTNKMYEYNITRTSFDYKEFTEDGTFTVPSTGTYSITAYGAAGGGSASAAGGNGAEVYASFDLTAGSSLTIKIGKKGGSEPAGSGHFYYGGGATEVLLNDNKIIIAGGGGGAVDYYFNIPGENAGNTSGKSRNSTIATPTTDVKCSPSNSYTNHSTGGKGLYDGYAGEHCPDTVGSGGGGTSYTSGNYSVIADGTYSPNTGDGKVIITKN